MQSAEDRGVKQRMLPDGSIGEFPISMSDEAIENVFKKQFPPKNPGASQYPAVNEIMNKLKSPDYQASALGQIHDPRARGALNFIMKSPMESMQALGKGAALAILPGELATGALRLTGIAPEAVATNAASRGWMSDLNPKEAPIDFRQKTNFSPQESEFNNIKPQVPGFLNEQAPPSLSANIANDTASKLMGNRNLEQSGKELASHVNETYEGIKNFHANKFNEIFDSPTGDVSVQTDEPILVKDKLIPKSQSSYRSSDALQDTSDKNLRLLDQRVRETPNIRNFHDLQSELGSEIGYMKKQRENGLLDAEGKNRLNSYVNAQQLIQDDIRSQLHNINPELKERYDVAREEWKKNVIPYHTDKDLRDIAEGRIKNPEASKITGIFRNPEENINKVVGDLHPAAKDRISHIAMGKVAEDITPEQLMNARRSLDTNGMSSYVNPEHEQNFRALRNSLQTDKENKARTEANEIFKKGLQKAQETANTERIAASKQREKGQKAAYNESNKILQNYQKNIQSNYEEGLKAAAEQKKARVNLYKKIGWGIGGTALAGAGLHEYGINQGNITAAVLAAMPKEFWNK